MKKWCKHMKWNEHIEDYLFDQIHVTKTLIDATGWMFCPICGKPRPKGNPR